MSKQSMPWFRMYAEARTDAKLRTLTDEEFRIWFSLLCFASEQPDEARGSIVGYDDELLAIECNAIQALLRVTVDKLKRLRILSEDENGISFCSFNRRQYDKPSDAPERVRARVAKSRAQKQEQGVVTGNADVTRSNAVKRTEEDADADVEKDSEGEKERSPSSGVISSSDVAEDAREEKPAATAARKPTRWTKSEKERVAELICNRMALSGKSAHVYDDMVATIAGYPYAPEFLLKEAAACAEWQRDNGKKPSVRAYGNWVDRTLARREQEIAQASTVVTQAAAESMNGSHGNSPGANGRHPQADTQEQGIVLSSDELAARRELGRKYSPKNRATTQPAVPAVVPDGDGGGLPR